MHCSASGADCRPKVVESTSVGHLRLIYSPFGEFKRAAGISYPATLWLPFILCRYRIYFTWHLIRRSQSPGSVDVGRWAESRQAYSPNLFKTKGRPIYPRINWSTINYSNVLFLLSLLLSDSNSQGIELEPEVEGRISNVTFPAGREAVLTCSVRNLGRYKVNKWHPDSIVVCIRLSIREALTNPSPYRAHKGVAKTNIIS